MELDILRVAVGAFFAIAGYNKLANLERREHMVDTMRDLRIPFPRFNARFVPCVELGAGALLALGLGCWPTVAAALLLGAVCLVAACTDGVRRVREFHPINKADAVADVLYLQEVLYGLVLVCVILSQLKEVLS